jgi:hypothetical protein
VLSTSIKYPITCVYLSVSTYVYINIIDRSLATLALVIIGMPRLASSTHRPCHRAGGTVAMSPTVQVHRRPGVDLHPGLGGCSTGCGPKQLRTPLYFQPKIVQSLGVQPHPTLIYHRISSILLLFSPPLASFLDPPLPPMDYFGPRPPSISRHGARSSTRHQRRYHRQQWHQRPVGSAKSFHNCFHYVTFALTFY